MPKKKPKPEPANNPPTVLVAVPTRWCKLVDVPVVVTVQHQRDGGVTYPVVTGFRAFDHGALGTPIDKSVLFEARFVPDVVHQWRTLNGTRQWRLYTIQPAT